MSANTPVAQCKIFDYTNGHKRKPASNILKRGRTIIKKRHESRKNVSRTNLFKAMTESDDLDPSRTENLECLPPQDQNDLGLSEDINLTTISHESAGSDDGSSELSCSKELIKLDDKLISGEEVEFCYTSDLDILNVDNKRNEFTCRIDRLESIDNVSQTRRLSPESNDSDNKTQKKNTSKCEMDSNELFKFTEDRSRLCSPNKSASEENVRLSSLKDIKSIQNTGKDSYSINISNSRFFVPKNYVFSGVESSMDDLKFEVDPEMKKVLQESTQTNNNAENPRINSKQKSECLNESKLETDKENSLLSQSLNMSKESDTSFKLGDDCTNDHSLNKKRRLFLKKSESRLGSEIVDSLLDSTIRNQDVFNSAIQNKNISTSLDNLNFRTAIHSTNIHDKSEYKKELNTVESTNFIRRDSIEYKDENVSTYLRPQSVPTRSCLYKKSEKDTKLLHARKTSPKDTRMENIEKSTPNRTEKRNAYQILSTSNSLLKSAVGTSPILVTSEIALTKSSNSDLKDSIQSPSTSAEKAFGEAVKVDDELRTTGQNLKFSEINRLKRMKFLNTNLSRSETNTEEQHKIDNSIVRNQKKSAKSELKSKNLDSKNNQNNNDAAFTCKDKSLIGRTSSLREKFETIIEDVELRPGRQIGTIRDSKSPSSMEA